MKEVIGNLWDYHQDGHWVVISTNGVVDRAGANVMGRGVALQAKKRFPSLPVELGTRIKEAGNTVHLLSEYQVITFPVKHHWRQSADLVLIEESAQELARIPL